MIIYGAYFKNKIVYVGKTIKDLSQRIDGHKKEAKRTKYPFHLAILKYGIEQFDFIVLDNCSSLDELNRRECFFIETMKPRFNIMKGGNGGFEKGSKTAKKVSLALKGRPSPNKGKKMSDEQKNKIREAQLKCYSEGRRSCPLTKEARKNGLKNRNQSEISKRAVLITNNKRWGTPISTDKNVVLYKSSLIDLEAEKSVTGRKRKGSVND